MAKLWYSKEAAAVVTGGLGRIYTSLLDLNIIEEDFCRMLLALAQDWTQSIVQRHKVIVDGETRFVIVIKTPTGIDGDLAIFWRPVMIDGKLRPFVSAITPGYGE